MEKKRAASGIPGLDRILKGGFLPGLTYMLVGRPGTGKTIFSIQWLLEGKRQQEKGLFITLVESAEMIERNVSGFGWNLEGIDIMDLSRDTRDTDLELGEYHVFPATEVEQIPVWKNIREAVAQRRPKRVVIDSITQLQQGSTDVYQFRRHLLSLIRFMREMGATTIVLFEPTDLLRETSVASVVDAILCLHKEISPERVIDLRSLQVEKYRGSDFIPGRHPMRIGPTGIVLFPHVVESPREVPLGTETLGTGVPEIDELIGGGLESGTATVISGPSGTGKSTLGTRILVEAASSGKSAVLYTFEETVRSILLRSRNLGLPLESLLESGTLRIRQVNTLDLYPDEFLQRVRETVEEEGCEIVMLDSLRGYQLAMEQFGSHVAHLQNMFIYLKGRGCTVLLINETENLTGHLKMTETGISFLADNIILLRYYEYGGEIVRVLGCMKKRLGLSKNELRELIIDSGGIRAGRRVRELRNYPSDRLDAEPRKTGT
ncbi:MAG: AAA family ATPase [Deltaproteobacteria bacterium]|nr:AAA family ATPase [Deltaproteobacteria bacterium]MBW2304144.1 AAA family ATPase [Deltaproteobacteria bacterium]